MTYERFANLRVEGPDAQGAGIRELVHRDRRISDGEALVDVPVVIRPATVIRLGQSGLTLADIREGETAIGHEVVVSGNLNTRAARGIIAEVVTVLPKPARP